MIECLDARGAPAQVHPSECQPDVIRQVERGRKVRGYRFDVHMDDEMLYYRNAHDLSLVRCVTVMDMGVVVFGHRRTIPVEGPGFRVPTIVGDCASKWKDVGDPPAAG